jgi:flagellar basal-body rod protein FlgG
MSPSFTQMLEVSKSGLYNRLLDLDVVSNNLANFSTSGFKETRTNFQELLNRLSPDSQNITDANVQNDLLGDMVGGTQISSTQDLMQQGALKNTGKALDLAITGEGFFGVNLPNGEIAYTRDGEFNLDSSRTIVDKNGNPLLWDGSVPEGVKEVEVDQGGNVSYLNEATGARENIGRISLYKFTNSSGLTHLGDNLYLESVSSGPVQTGTPSENNYGTITNRTLEASNVNLAGQMTRMVLLQRGFQLSVKSLQQVDQMLQQAIQMRQG